MTFCVNIFVHILGFLYFSIELSSCRTFLDLYFISNKMFKNFFFIKFCFRKPLSKTIWSRGILLVLNFINLVFFGKFNLPNTEKVLLVRDFFSVGTYRVRGYIYN